MCLRGGGRRPRSTEARYEASIPAVEAMDFCEIRLRIRAWKINEPNRDDISLVFTREVPDGAIPHPCSADVNSF